MSEHPNSMRSTAARECSLRGQGTCSGKISGEHYISAALLREISTNGTILVQGTPWAFSEPLRVSIKSLTANVICQGHNSRLSKLDSLAQRFFGAIKDAQLSLQAHKGKSRTHTFDGVLLERWFLKVIYMMWTSGNLSRDGKCITGRPPDIWGEYLLGIKDFPALWGLYVKPVGHPFATYENNFEVVSLSGVDGSGVKAGHFKLGSLPFTIILGQPDGDWGIHRPASIVLQQGNVSHHLRLNWFGSGSKEDIIYTRIADKA